MYAMGMMFVDCDERNENSDILADAPSAIVLSDSLDWLSLKGLSD